MLIYLLDIVGQTFRMSNLSSYLPLMWNDIYCDQKLVQSHQTLLIQLKATDES